MLNNTVPHLMPERRAGAMYPLARSQTRRISNLGFIVAGLCVLTGGFILVFVYVMASGLPSTNTSTIYAGITPTSKSIVSSPAAATSTPTVALSPTVSAFPGQQFIDNPQMASLVNTNTAQPIETTTTFRINQKIYVTFNIHPAGKNGAVCLYWFLNHRDVTQFPFAVTASASTGYSYAIYGGTGPGYVEIYWASSTTCSDRLLAQHVNFTVTA